MTHPLKAELSIRLHKRNMRQKIEAFAYRNHGLACIRESHPAHNYNNHYTELQSLKRDKFLSAMPSCSQTKI